MRKRMKGGLAACGIAAALTLAITPSTAQDGSLEMLSKLDRGGWDIRFRDGSAGQSICLRNGSELIQLRHQGATCNRFVVEDGANEVTVQYTCRGNGYGRTNIRRESSALVQIESQGIVDGKPFQFTAEARRSGTCR